jgi:hypothetical protein
MAREDLRGGGSGLARPAPRRCCGPRQVGRRVRARLHLSQDGPRGGSCCPSLLLHSEPESAPGWEAGLWGRSAGNRVGEPPRYEATVSVGRRIAGGRSARPPRGRKFVTINVLDIRLPGLRPEATGRAWAEKTTRDRPGRRERLKFSRSRFTFVFTSSGGDRILGDVSTRFRRTADVAGP